jgi:signal transduction histidine kinase
MNRNLEEECKSQVMRGDGEMSALMRGLDWSGLPAGRVCEWSETLRTVVSLCLGSRHAIEIWWGPEYLRFYNDAYRPILGATKHPQFIGRPGQEMWAEIWDTIEPLLRKVRETGEASWYEDYPLFVTRNGYTEESYFSFSYGPVYEGGEVAGIFSACTETTAHVLQRRRLRLLRQISVEGTAETLEQAVNSCTHLLSDDPEDVPFAMVFLCEPNGESMRLVSSVGLGQGAASIPESVPLSEFSLQPGASASPGVPFYPTLLKDISGWPSEIVAGPWNEPHDKVAVLPLRRANGDELAGVLVAGISARLNYSEEYRVFLDLLSAQVSSAVARTTAFLEERQRAESFAKMFDAAPAFMAVLRGPDHVFEMVNPRYRQLLGHRHLLGQSVRAAVPEVEGQGFLELLDRVYETGEPFHGDSLRVELQSAPDRPTEVRYLTFVYQPLKDAEERVTGIFVLGMDVSENVIAHEALRRSERLSAAGRLAATIAHEVNNPLEAMTNLLFLAKIDGGENLPKYLDMAEGELRRIAQITRQTLSFYKESTIPAPFDLSATVASILMFFKKQASAKGIAVLTDLKPGCEMVAIEGEIKQVLSNLLTNAIDAIHGEGGRIWIRTHKRDGAVRLLISDTGSGISPEVLKRIWEPFFTTKEAVGTGLGLWTTKEILAKHHARLRLRSNAKGAWRGTTFVIDFPADFAAQN